MNPSKNFFALIILLSSLTCLGQFRNIHIQAGLMSDITQHWFDTDRWYGDEVGAPFPRTWGGLTVGIGSTLMRVVYWSADFQYSYGEGLGRRPRSTHSFGLPVTIGLVTPNEKIVKWKIGLFGGPQRFVHNDEPDYPYHTVLYYGLTSGFIIPFKKNSLNVDAFYAPKLKVSQNPDRVLFNEPTEEFEHYRVSVTYRWNPRSQ